MEIEVKFNAYELKLIWHALKLGEIHHPDETKSEEMGHLMKKVELINELTKEEILNEL